MDDYLFDDKLKDKVRYLYFYLYKLDNFEKSIDNYIIEHGDDFYFYLFLSRSTTSQLIYLIINEEISNSIERKPLFDLYDQLWKDDDNEGINVLFRGNLLYEHHLKDLFINQFNGMLQNSFFDYQVSMWSAFEASISNIFYRLYKKHEEDLEESHYKKLVKLLNNKIFKEHKLTENQLNILAANKNKFLKEFPRYVSSDDQINCIFKDLETYYDRDVKNDKKILHFIRSLRNTAHNNGTHKKSNISISINGYEYCLETNQFGNFSSDINIVKLYFELLNIYISLILALHQKLNKT